MNKKKVIGLGLSILLSCGLFGAEGNLSEQEQLELENARTALEQSQYDRALELLEPLYASFPNQAEITNNFAVALFNAGRTTEAGIILQEYLQSHGEVGVPSNNLFLVYDYLAAESYSMLSGSQPNLPQLSLVSSGASYQSKPVATQAPAPALPTKVTNEEFNSESAAIQRRLEGYVKAWSDGNIQDYLSYYFPNTSPIRGQKYEYWRNERAEKIFPARDISVRTDDLQLIPIDDSRAISVFTQNYNSRNYSDETTKQLTWVKNEGEWFIRYEIALPN